MRALLLLALLPALTAGCVYDFNRAWDAGVDVSQPDQRLSNEAGSDAQPDGPLADGPPADGAPDAGVNVLDNKPFVICSQAKSNCKAPDVAFDGSKFLVVWQDDRGSKNDIYGRLVASDGTTGKNEIIISAATNHQNAPAVTYGGVPNPHFLVAWHDLRAGTKPDIWARWIAPAGVPGSEFEVSGDSSEETDVALAAGGIYLLLAWRTVDQTNGDQNIAGARVKYDAIPQNYVKDNSPLELSQKGGEERDPTVTFDGTNFFVAWYDDNGKIEGDIHGARFSELTGDVLASDKTNQDHGIAICSDPKTQRQPAVAYLKSAGYQLIWSDRTAVDYEDDIMGARVVGGSKLNPASVLKISDASSIQEEPAIAAGKTGFLAVWDDGRSDHQIFATRIDAKGFALDPKGVAIAPSTYMSSHTPAVAYDAKSGQYLVVWSELETYRKVYGVRVKAP